MKFFKKSDILIAAVLLIVSLGVYLVYDSIYGQSETRAEIYYYSELAKTVELNSGETGNFSISQEPDVVFHISDDGTIAFVESDCPDKVCIKTGALDSVGQYAACLPNGVVLKIVPAGERNVEDPDIVVGR
ncbi:MAG: hypothetical protein CVU86_00865 [Firmicutes bacterium HGW-Firmicutes-11]|jgi:hypothetical protein|nr:MAG: hypothetical protein CVU86_00865 [Firmicutes bacterium HGW-Firmicutes-11]